MGHRRSRPFRPVVGPLEARLNLSTTATTTVPSILYVNAAATGSTTTPDGSSWARAYTSLQDALTEAATANKPEQIWIAQGTYTPSQVYSPLNSSGTAVAGGASGATTSNLETFSIPNNVTLLGGFRAGATSALDRSPKLDPTILTGDIDGNDLTDPTAAGYAASKADNAYHVVTIGDDVTQTGTRATLSGLTITDGYANGTDVGGVTAAFVQGGADGGGVLAAYGSHVNLDHDIFTDDSATNDGGAVFASGSDLVISTSSFTGSTAGVAGGAVGVQGGSQGTGSALIVSGSTFSGNSAATGGALAVDTETAFLNETQFLTNTATASGGAIAASNAFGTTLGTTNTDATTVTTSSFVGNVAQGSTTAQTTLDGSSGTTGSSFGLGGGAIVADDNGRLDAGLDFFRNNTATNGNGGAILDGDSSINTGAVSGYGATTRVFGSTFLTNNAANGHGGAIAAETDGLIADESNTSTALTVAGSSFDGNTSTDSGLIYYINNATANLYGNYSPVTTATTGNLLVATGSIVNGAAKTTTTTTGTTTTTTS